MPGIMRYFLHLPFTHAEDLAMQEVGGMERVGEWGSGVLHSCKYRQYGKWAGVCTTAATGLARGGVLGTVAGGAQEGVSCRAASSTEGALRLGLPTRVATHVARKCLILVLSVLLRTACQTSMQKCVELAGATLKELEAAGPAAAPAAQFMASAHGFSIKHRDVVAAWGRFPHRNAILGRDSTPEELAGLADGSIHKF